MLWRDENAHRAPAPQLGLVSLAKNGIKKAACAAALVSVAFLGIIVEDHDRLDQVGGLVLHQLQRLGDVLPAVEDVCRQLAHVQLAGGDQRAQLFHAQTAAGHQTADELPSIHVGWPQVLATEAVHLAENSGVVILDARCKTVLISRCVESEIHGAGY